MPTTVADWLRRWLAGLKGCWKGLLTTSEDYLQETFAGSHGH